MSVQEGPIHRGDQVWREIRVCEGSPLTGKFNTLWEPGEAEADESNGVVPVWWSKYIGPKEMMRTTDIRTTIPRDDGIFNRRAFDKMRSERLAPAN